MAHDAATHTTRERDDLALADKKTCGKTGTLLTTVDSDSNRKRNEIERKIDVAYDKINEVKKGYAKRKRDLCAELFVVQQQKKRFLALKDAIEAVLIP